MDAREVSKWLRANPWLDKKMIGEYISDRRHPEILDSFVRYHPGWAHSAGGISFRCGERFTGLRKDIKLQTVERFDFIFIPIIIDQLLLNAVFSLSSICSKSADKFFHPPRTRLVYPASRGKPIFAAKPPVFSGPIPPACSKYGSLKLN